MGHSSHSRNNRQDHRHNGIVQSAFKPVATIRINEIKTQGNNSKYQQTISNNSKLANNNNTNSHGSLTINLSNIDLSDADQTLLDKGLSFIPTYRKFPIDKIYDAQNRLIRNLKLKDYFQSQTNYKYNPKIKTFKHPSTWIPPDRDLNKSTMTTIQDIISTTASLVQTGKQDKHGNLFLNNTKNNLTHNEKIALDKLKNNSEIVIKGADKGSSTVIMNKQAYLNEAYRQLNNTKYYRKIPKPIFKSNIPKINNILEDIKTEGYISDKQFNYLKATDTDRARTFYLLPKIHKPKDKWPQPDMPEGRPIVSDTGSESYRASQFIDSFIRPISTGHPAYLKDTYDFLNKIRGKQIPKNSILVTADVSSLYTNMDINRTLLVTREAMKIHPNPNRPDKLILDLLELTLKNNDFTFNGEYFLQICGTAMGKNYAPGLADLYLAYLDDKAINYKINPLFFFRFLDDIFFVWTGTLEELDEFQQFLNSLIPGINITFTVSHEKVDFLDTTVYKLNTDSELISSLQTRVFFKETDTHQLLHSRSFHPKHTFKSVLKSQLLRFKRISSTKEDYDNTCSILFNVLNKRGYSKRMLRQFKLEVWRQGDTLEPNKNHSDEKVLPIIVPYNNIGIKLARHWKNLLKNNDLFKQFKLITAYCNSHNLKQKLVRASLVQPLITRQPTGARVIISGSHRCTNIKCKACNYISETSIIKSTHNNRTFKLTDNINCKTCNIIYLITCKKCFKQYVGETGRSLADRINQHISCIRLKKETPIGLHFNQSDHSIRHFSIMGIDKMMETSDALLKRRNKENTWQTILQTTHPSGINNFNSNLLE